MRIRKARKMGRSLRRRKIRLQIKPRHSQPRSSAVREFGEAGERGA